MKTLKSRRTVKQIRVKEKTGSLTFTKHQQKVEHHVSSLRDKRYQEIALGAGVLLFILFILGGPHGMTGSIIRAGYNTYSDNVSIIAQANTTSIWAPTHVGPLSHASISGSIKGNGTVTVFLNEWLIFSNVETKESETAITGLIVYDGSSTTGDDGIRYLIDACTENCLLPSLNESNYTIRVEADHARLEIERITYTIKEQFEVNPLPAFLYVGNITLSPGETRTFGMDQFFNSSEGNISYIAVSSDNITAAIESGLLTISSEEGFLGRAWMRLYASDGVETVVSPDIIVDVTDSINHPPVLVKGIADIRIGRNSNYTLLLSEYFADQDHDQLFYRGVSPDNATLFFDRGSLMVVPAYDFIGNTTVILYAHDSAFETASNEFQVEVVSAPAQEKPEVMHTRVEIGKPVRWSGLLGVHNSESSEKVLTINITVPSYSNNITIYDSHKQIKHEAHATKKDPQENKPKRFGTAQEPKTESITEIVFNDTIPANNTKKYTVEYYTEAPQVIETETASKKTVTVSSDVNYTDILTYTTIAGTKSGSIHLYWYATRSDYANYVLGDPSAAGNLPDQMFKVDITSDPQFYVKFVDTDSDGLIDRLEWITPHLSNQTFEISITILNVQSYPSINGNWTVQFNTTGIPI
jgi:hypothetical protein